MADPLPPHSVSARVTPPTADTEVGVAVSQRATARRPPRVRVALTNTGDEPRRLDAGFTPPFSTYVLDRDGCDARLVLVPAAHPDERHVPSEPREGCWTATGVPDLLDTGTLTTLAVGETIADEYVLLNHPENESCFPAGRYSATDAVHLGESSTPVEIELAVEVARENGN